MFAGFFLITLIYIVFKPLIIDAYIEKSRIFIEYYYVLIPLSLFTLIFNVFESFVRSIHKTVFAAFLKDVMFRLLTTAGIFLVFFKIITFPQFVIYYVLSNAFIAILLISQIIYSKQFRFIIDYNSIKFKKVGEILKYGMFTLLAGSSYFFAQNIDKIMLGSMVGIEIVGIYSVFLYIGTVVIFPARSMYRITVPIVADCWKNNDIEQIRNIYRRTSLLLMIFGSIIYIGIFINKDNISYFLKPEYRANFIFYYFLGLSFLIDMTGGMNSDIINTSPKYKFDALFNLIYMVLCVILAYIFIKIFGGLGAAIAIALSMFVFNFIKWAFLFRSYGLQPFNRKNLSVILISLITLIIGLYIPLINNIYADILVRSSVVAVIYFGLVILLKVSDDITEKYHKYKNKLLLRGS